MPVFSRNKKKKGYADMDDDDDDGGGSSADMEFVPIHLTKTVPMKDSAEKERQKAALKAKEKKMRSRMKKHKVKMDAEKEGRRQAFEGNVTSQLEMYASSKTGSHLMDMSANHDNLETCENLLDESESLFNDCDEETAQEQIVVGDDEDFASQINTIKAKKETAKQKERDAFLAAKKKKEEKKKRKKEKEKSSKEKDKKSSSSSKSDKKSSSSKDKDKDKDKAEREKARVDHKANFKQREKEHKEHLKRKKAAEKERKRKAKEEKALEKERKKIEKMAASSEMAGDGGSGSYNNDSSGSSRNLLGGTVASTRRLFGKQLSGKKLSRRFSNGLGLFKKTSGGGGGTTTTAAEDFQEQESIRTRNGFKPRSDVTNLWGVENTKKY